MSLALFLEPVFAQLLRLERGGGPPVEPGLDGRLLADALAQGGEALGLGRAIGTGHRANRITPLTSVDGRVNGATAPLESSAKRPAAGRLTRITFRNGSPDKVVHVERAQVGHAHLPSSGSAAHENARKEPPLGSSMQTIRQT